MNKEIINIIKSTKTVDELKKLANINGYPLSDEEVKNYFDMYHTSGKISERELDNVSGGDCEIGTYVGKASEYWRGECRYSTEGNHNLVVTLFNNCSMFSPRQDAGTDNSCGGCVNVYYEFPTHYCKARTYHNDPLNKIKA